MTDQESPNRGAALRIIYEDNHLLAVDKPAGLPSQPDSSGDPSLDVLAKDYLRHRYNKPGDVYLGLLHRLDRPTSGVVLMARTGKAATRMADLFRRREVEKSYLAVVQAAAQPPAQAQCRNWLTQGENGSMVAGTEKSDRAREARLTYSLIAHDAAAGLALLAVDLQTGVKHQIRSQLAAAGMPIVGDFRYGFPGKIARPQPVCGGRAILLHARRAGFIHPVKREPVRISAPLPAYWHGFVDAMEGTASLFTENET
ncbi:MAG: RluA family pseudouridine synthase [Planctomycetaceae bacterium]|nr:RluA family pseudouridine synthase [Planctomycetaceae bacterium]